MLALGAVLTADAFVAAALCARLVWALPPRDCLPPLLGRQLHTPALPSSHRTSPTPFSAQRKWRRSRSRRSPRRPRRRPVAAARRASARTARTVAPKSPVSGSAVIRAYASAPAPAFLFCGWGAAPSWAPLYISKVVKGLQGKFKMSKKAMAIVNSFAADLFDRGQTPRWRLGCVLRLLVGASAPPFLARPAAFRPLRIAGEAGRLAKHTGAKTLSSAGMQAACRLQGSSGHPQPRHCLPGSVPTAPRPEAPSCPASWPSTP